MDAVALGLDCFCMAKQMSGYDLRYMLASSRQSTFMKARVLYNSYLRELTQPGEGPSMAIMSAELTYQRLQLRQIP